MKNLFVLLILALLLMSACAQPDKTATENKALAQRFIEEVWNQGNLDVVDEVLAADFVRHNPASWDPSTVEGPEGFKEYVNNIRTLYPDFHVEIGSWVAEGDLVAVSWTVTGTNQDAHKEISVKGIGMTRYANGKAVEEWSTWDTYGLMQQLGMIPTVETTEK